MVSVFYCCDINNFYGRRKHGSLHEMSQLLAWDFDDTEYQEHVTLNFSLQGHCNADRVRQLEAKDNITFKACP